MNNCTICHQPIVLIPSASVRAARHGGLAQDYTNLFTSHPSCFMDKYRRDTSALMARLRGE